MSLPRGCNLQDTRGTLYCPRELHPTGRVEHQSGRFICSSSTNDVTTGITASPGTAAATIAASVTTVNSAAAHSIDPTCLYHLSSAEAPWAGGVPMPFSGRSLIDDCDLPELASSQPAAPSILTECCQQSTGSLFSIVSAPPLAELDVKQVGTLGGSTGLSDSMPDHSTLPRRPATLPINTPYGPAATLHASLLEHQISEIEEDDNENLLTVSSITARPLIAKSREICTQKRQQRGVAAGKQPPRQSKPPPRSVRCTPAKGAPLARSSEDKYTAATSMSSRASSESADPPDGGYGWFIVFGAFSVQFWVAGLVKSYGVLYVEIMETFASSTATVASWIPAILSALCLVLAPLSSALCQRFSCRSVVFVGGLFCAMGLTLSYFATSLLHLLFTFGILTGIGGGLSTTPGIVIVSQYFDKHRALANGICVSGTAAGSFILPMLIKHLAENFGFHGTILILGGCMLDVCVSALLYRPIESNVSDRTDEEDDRNGEDMDDAEGRGLRRPLNRESHPSALLTGSTYIDMDTCLDNEANDANRRFIEHLFLEETNNRLNDLYTNRALGSSVDEATAGEKASALLENGDADDDEIKDMIGETTFIKRPIKKVRSSGLMHSVEDLSTDSTFMYRKHSGTDSNRGSRRRRNVFANDELISKIQAHLQKPHSPPSTVGNRGLSKSMEIPTPVSNLSDLKTTAALAEGNEDLYGNGSLRGRTMIGEDDNDEDEETGLNEDCKSRTCCERIGVYLDLTLLRDTSFILMCLSVTLMSVGCPYMLYYLPAHVISIGYSKSEAGYLVAISAVLDLCGRLGLGWLSDLQLFDRRKTYVLCIFGAGVAVLTIPTSETLYLIGVSAATYGLCLGSWYVLMPVLLADIFGTDRISSSYGLVRMFQSIGAISVPPLAGFLRDLSGSYKICFYCMGTCMVLGCVPLIIWSVLDRQREGRAAAAARAVTHSPRPGSLIR